MLLKLILILSILSIKSYSDFIDSNYYNISASQLKILKIDDNRFIFYGDNGTVLRSYDGCKTWEQNFSGSHSTIQKLIYINDQIFGMTDSDEFIYSVDAGNHWVVNKLVNIIDFTITDENICFILSDDGIYKYNFEDGTSIKLDISYDNVTSINNYNNELIINTKGNGYLFLDYNFNLQSEIGLANYEIIFKNKALFFKQSQNLVEYKEGDTTNIIIPKYIGDDYLLYPHGNIIYLINSNIENEIISIYNLNRLNNSINLVYNNSIKGLRDEYYKTYDIEFLDEELIFTNFGKTIIKTNISGENFEVLSYLPINHITTNIRFLDSNNIYFTGGNGLMIYSHNGGKTFLPSNDILIDTVNNIPQITTIQDIYLDNNE